VGGWGVGKMVDMTKQAELLVINARDCKFGSSC